MNDKLQIEHLHLNKLAHPLYMASMAIPVVIFVLILFAAFSFVSSDNQYKSAYSISANEKVLSASTEAK